MSVTQNLTDIKAQIAAACKNAGKNAEDVKLIAVSKTWPAEHVQKAIDAGQRFFGENKLQEGQEKIPVLSSELEWHFIGGLQRNKVRKVLSLFDVIHSVDSAKLAHYMNHVAEEMKICPAVFLQINIGDEASKGGFSLKDLEVSFPELLALKHLDIVGLMCIPPEADKPEDARIWFRKMAGLKDQLEKIHHCKLPQLSMGMSGDFEIAISEGATCVRIGSSIFGAR